MPRARLPFALDVAALVVGLAAVLMGWTGGFYTEIGGLRISARANERPLILFVLIVLVRWWKWPRVPAFGIERERRNRFYKPESDREPLSARRSWGSFGLAALGTSLFGATLLHRQLQRMDAVPDLGDPLFSIWRMGWLHQQLRGDPRPLFDANIYYPSPLTLTFSDSMLLPSLTGAPLLASGVPPVYVYNLVFLSGFLLSSLAMYVLVVRLTGSRLAAFASALMFGFYPFRFEHYSHLELQMTYWMPLALLALHWFSETLRLRYLIAATVLTVAQLYSAMYFGVFFSIYAAVVLWVMLRASSVPWRRLVTPALTSAALGLILIVPLARPYLAAQALKGNRDVSAVRFYSASPIDYLRAHIRSGTYHGVILDDKHAERALFPGFLPIVFAIGGLLPPLGRRRLAYAAGLLVALDISFGFNGIIYRYLYDWFLPIRGMRVPARMSMVVGMTLCVLAGYGVQRLLRLCRTRGTRVMVGAALVAGIAVDLWPDPELHSVWLDPPPIYAPVAGKLDVVLAEVPIRDHSPEFTESMPYLYFSLWHWAPMVNGYSGFSPPAYDAFVDVMRDFPAPVSIVAMRMLGVTHVTVNCALALEGCEATLEKVDTMPVFRRIVASEWRGRPARLYEFNHGSHGKH